MLYISQYHHFNPIFLDNSWFNAYVDRGVQLIERNEEVCIFYEKVNIQSKFIYTFIQCHDYFLNEGYKHRNTGKQSFCKC